VSELRLLLVEANPLDAELILARLAEEGFACRPTRVETREAFIAALGEPLDLILADYALPGFEGRTALQIARERCPDVPFLFVSGALGEELVVELLRVGATDCILKHRLERLGPSVRRALGEARERRERQRLEVALRQRAEELVEAGRRKDEFLAMLSHELRNPLAPIRTALHVLRRSGSPDPNAGRAREIIERQVDQLSRLIDDLLDVSRIARGKIQLARQVTDLRSIVRLAVETSRPLIEQRQHRLDVALPPEPLWVEADAARLGQVLTNLLNNAAKYTDPGGQIALTATREAAEAVLSVRDTGVGVPPALQPRIFDMFMQADRSAHQTQGGLGLGLTLVRRLVEMHGGSIGVVSEGAGKGSEFIVRLPLAAAPAVAPAAPQVSAEPAAGQPMRLLVVDDNQDGAESLALMLRLWGHEVSLAYDGTTALKKVQAEQPDVVLLDIGLPGMDGYEVARRVRQQPELERIALVAMTGYGQDEDRRRSSEVGFDDHLVKPVDVTALERLLRTLPSRSPG
jgi:signal transduction histidine kinase/ActR/RegA family two-component response regulator